MPAVKPQAMKKFGRPGAGPMMGSPSAETGMGPLIRLCTPSSSSTGSRSVAPWAMASKRSKLESKSVRAKSQGGALRQQALVSGSQPPMAKAFTSGFR